MGTSFQLADQTTAGTAWKRRRTARRARPFALLALMAALPIASCSGSDELTGHVFISGVKDSTGTLVALAVDFVPDDRDADMTDVRINVNANTTFFVDDYPAFSHRCLALPSTGRLTLVANGALDSSIRVRVEAVRVEDGSSPSAPAATSTTAAQAGNAGRGGSTATTGGSAGSSGALQRCAGDPIDDAVWPNVGASVPPAPPGTGGTAGGGGSGGNGGMAGTGGSESGGAPAAGGADSGGAPGSGGSAGADSGGAPAAGAAAGASNGGSNGDAGSGASSGTGNDASGMSGNGGG
jgi:hypothetical protein